MPLLKILATTSAAATDAARCAARTSYRHCMWPCDITLKVLLSRTAFINGVP